MVNENKNNSLNRKTQNIADFFKTKEIDPYISTVILNNAIANILPYPNYIKPDYDFQELVFTNQLNNDVTVQKRAKIYKLAKYIGEKIDKKKITTFLPILELHF
ncbi:hypothetical protein NW069_00215 [Mycoplasmopsis cynos]|uniref:hypothetical protein n=1 Tax=Mycoplasmopsis cynos TaxID=171284 RepID=UPI0022013327|nr:hypothetical protein [Mycoplasmopsis cynos]MCU9932651.1 hypothetical protein [Mycoplasmopsis cynos]UWV80645.1 hypothetical protein NW069_00215 [Mycoplasmopsis cynos]